MQKTVKSPQQQTGREVLQASDSALRPTWKSCVVKKSSKEKDMHMFLQTGDSKTIIVVEISDESDDEPKEKVQDKMCYRDDDVLQMFQGIVLNVLC